MFKNAAIDNDFFIKFLVMDVGSIILNEFHFVNFNDV